MKMLDIFIKGRDKMRRRAAFAAHRKMGQRVECEAMGGWQKIHR